MAKLKRIGQFRDELLSTFPDGTIGPTAAAKLLQSHLEETNRETPEVEKNETAFFADGLRDYHSILVNARTRGVKFIGPVNDPKTGKLAEDRANKRMAIKGFKLYEADSAHIRVHPKKAEHVGVIQMVRVTLPKTSAPKNKPRKNDIKTPIGWVRAADHLAFSHSELKRYAFREQYSDAHPDGKSPKLPAFERVELITPARYRGARFCPIAIYLGYTNENDRTPSFYILEAGNALGQFKVMYAAPTMKHLIVQKSGYAPTPFAHPDHIYTAQLEVKRNEPVLLTIHVSKEVGGTTDFTIKMGFKQATVEEVASAEKFIPPASQTLKAFLRIQALRNVKFGFGIPQLRLSPLERRIMNLRHKIVRRKSDGKPVKNLQKTLERLERKNS